MDVRFLDELDRKEIDKEIDSLKKSGVESNKILVDALNSKEVQASTKDTIKTNVKKVNDIVFNKEINVGEKITKNHGVVDYKRDFDYDIEIGTDSYVVSIVFFEGNIGVQSDLGSFIINNLDKFTIMDTLPYSNIEVTPIKPGTLNIKGEYNNLYGRTEVYIRQLLLE